MKQQILMEKLYSVILKNPVRTIHEGGNAQQWIFSLDQAAFCWKEMPSRTFHSWGGEVSAWLQSLKGQPDCLVRG